LDPTVVEVDLWQFQDLLARAPTASPCEREGMLREACALYTAPLAEGCDYDWVEPYRERVRQQAVDAHLLLADVLVGAQPQQAIQVLDGAIAIDRYNEELYRRAMRLRHQIGDTDGVRALHRALRLALADLDSEPNPTTTRLLDELTAP
jgi:DNA-binding SARP family transcriptional activator